MYTAVALVSQTFHFSHFPNIIFGCDSAKRYYHLFTLLQVLQFQNKCLEMCICFKETLHVRFKS